MTQKDVAKYYGDLSRGEKGRFTAFVSLRLGGSPHSWHHLVAQQPPGVVPLRRLFDDVQQRRIVSVRFGGIFRHALPGEGIRHPGSFYSEYALRFPR